MEGRKKRALNHLEEITDNRMHLDSFSPEGYNRLEEAVEETVENFYGSESENTLRGFLYELDLHFDPEEFIDEDEEYEIQPELLAVAVYMDRNHDLVSKQSNDEVYRKYAEEYTDMDREEEFFMLEEYVHQYY